MKKYLLINALLLSVQLVFAQCLMTPVNIDQKINNSELIIEGKVIEKKSFYQGSNIFTSNKIEVYKVFKGKLGKTIIEIITEGGIIGNKMEKVEPSLHLKNGMVGVFFCKSSKTKNKNSSINTTLQYEAFASAQGFIFYDLTNQIAADPFNAYSNISTEIYQILENKTGRNYTEVKPVNLFQVNNSRSAAPSITSFSPDTISAGTHSLLTINGTGFGATRGTGNVGFKNADDGGATYINPIAWEYKSWTDTKIEVYVNENSGIGTVQVTNNSSQTGTSSQALWVKYARLNTEYDNKMFMQDHVNDNGTGGYTFRYFTDFNNNANAVASFERALESWRCGTFINFEIGNVTSTDVATDDNINVVRFDNGSELPNGVLGRASSYSSGCFSASDTIWYIDEIDVVFDDGAAWEFGPASPSVSESDFESVTVHELGHAHQLGHVINDSWIMNYALTQGDMIRTLTSESDIAGGNAVMAQSVQVNACGSTKMIALSSGACALGVPTADFTFTTSALTVNLTNTSSGTITTYSWNFGDGKTGNTPDTNYTYADSGTYIVCLTVTNSNGSNSKCDTVTVSYSNCDSLLADAYSRSTNYDFEYIWKYGWGGVGQRYNSLKGEIKSVMFFGSVYPGSGPTNTVSVNIYSESAGKPGSLLGTKNIVIDTTQAKTSIFEVQRNVDFSPPIKVNGGNVIITVEPTIPASDDFYLFRNDTLNDGAGLQLALVKDSIWYNNLLQYSATRYNFDFLILPTFNDASCATCFMKASIAGTNITCNGNNDGIADLTVTDGTSPFTYEWSNLSSTEDLSGLSVSTYTVSVLDDWNCKSFATVTITEPTVLSINSTSVTSVTCFGASDGSIEIQATGGTGSYTYKWNNGQTTNKAVNLGTGTYTVTVKDANSCISIASSSVGGPADISGATSVTNVNCNGSCDGAINLTASGGINPLSIKWNNGNTSEDLTDLCSGNYTVTISDLKGCKEIITVAVSQPTAITLKTGSTNASCGGADGSAGVTASGGTSGYTYLWSNGETTDVIINLKAGSYNVTVTDNKGCTEGAEVAVNETGAPTLSATASDVSCKGNSDGSIDLKVSGGIQPYTFSWSIGSATEDISGLSAGSYTVTVTGNNGCKSIKANISVSEPTSMGLIISFTDVSCNGACDGDIAMSVSGGTPGYSYLWSNGKTSSDLSSLCAGTYSVTVTDSKGCKTIGNTTIAELTAITGSSSVTDASCDGAGDGSVTVTPSGGSGSYTFSWSNGSSTKTASGLNVGNYYATITDGSGCTGVVTANVSSNTVITVTATATNAKCNGSFDGSATANASGGTGTYSYIWSSDATTSSISNLGAGSYHVTAIDANSCRGNTTATVNQPTKLTLTVNSTNTAIGDSTGTAFVVAVGGTLPYSYLWSNGGTTAEITGLVIGTYSVDVKDGNGCKETATGIVDEGTSINDINYNDIINLYPNPASNNVNIVFSKPTVLLTKITITNTLGELVFEQNQNNRNEKHLMIDTKSFSRGIYFLNIVSDNYSVSKKIILIN